MAHKKVSSFPHLCYHVSYSWSTWSEKYGVTTQGFGEDTVTLDEPLDSPEQIRQLRDFLAENHPGQPCKVVIIAWNLL